MTEEQWEGHKIEKIYNNAVEDLHAIAESFAESKYGYVIEARYFTKEGLDVLREHGYQINHSEVRKAVKKGEDEPKVQISVDKSESFSKQNQETEDKT
jgi:hypothetical protein